LKRDESVDSLNAENSEKALAAAEAEAGVTKEAEAEAEESGDEDLIIEEL